MWIHAIALAVQLTFFGARHHYTKPMTIEECVKAKRCIAPIVVVTPTTETR